VANESPITEEQIWSKNSRTTIKKPSVSDLEGAIP